MIRENHVFVCVFYLILLEQKFADRRVIRRRKNSTIVICISFLSYAICRACSTRDNIFAERVCLMSLSTFEHLGLLESAQVTLLDEKSITEIYRIPEKRNTNVHGTKTKKFSLKIISAKSLEAINSTLLIHHFQSFLCWFYQKKILT